MKEEDWTLIKDFGPLHSEFDWFAIDINLNIAVFTVSTREAPIPMSVFSSINNYNMVFEYVNNLPNSSLVEQYYHKDVIDDWLIYAQKGIFAFDYGDVHRKVSLHQYDLIAKPLSPIPILGLDQDIIRYLPKLNVDFRESIKVANELISNPHKYLDTYNYKILFKNNFHEKVFQFSQFFNKLFRSSD